MGFKEFGTKIFLSLLLLSNPLFARTNPPFETGQIIAISQMNVVPVSFVFELATASRWSHNGIIYKDPVHDEIFVYEGTTPHAKLTRLTDFLSKATQNDAGAYEYTLAEPSDGLQPHFQDKIRKIVQKYLRKKISYNHSHVYRENLKNCSELSYDIYREAGIKLTDAAKEHSGLKPWQSLIDRILRYVRQKPLTTKPIFISPASILRSQDLRIVYSGLPLQPLSPLEIIELWEESGADKIFENRFEIPIRDFLKTCDRVVETFHQRMARSF